MAKKEIYFWFGIFALSTIAYSYIQDTLRPASIDYPDYLQYLLGVAPNYFAGISLPAIFMLLIPHLKPKAKTWTIIRVRNWSMLISIIGLLIWEFLQLTTQNGHFDIQDILWTFLGVFTFLILQQLIQQPLDSPS